MKKTKEYALFKLIKKEHEGKWIAVSTDYKMILGYSDDLINLSREVENKDVVYLKAPVSGMQYAFGA